MPPSPSGFGQVVGAALSGREGGGREGASGCPMGQIIAGQILLGAGYCSPMGGWGAWSCLRASVPAGDATVWPPVPSWTRPLAVSGQLRKAALGPPLQGAEGHSGPQVAKSRMVMGRLKRGQEFCLAYQNIPGMLSEEQRAAAPSGWGTGPCKWEWGCWRGEAGWGTWLGSPGGSFFSGFKGVRVGIS